MSEDGPDDQMRDGSPAERISDGEQLAIVLDDDLAVVERARESLARE